MSTQQRSICEDSNGGFIDWRAGQMKSDLHKVGKVKRQIGYGEELPPKALGKADVEHLIMESFRVLVDEFAYGNAATLQDIKGGDLRRKLFAERLLAKATVTP